MNARLVTLSSESSTYGPAGSVAQPSDMQYSSVGSYVMNNGFVTLSSDSSTYGPAGSVSQPSEMQYSSVGSYVKNAGSSLGSPEYSTDEQPTSNTIIVSAAKIFFIPFSL